MWRNSVLRLSTCSSTLVTRHVAKRWRSDAAASPIATTQFATALDNAYRQLEPSPTPKSKIGLAISGGVDSMALATLYTEAMLADEKRHPCRAFIINHGVRPESAEEAEWVKEQLRFCLNIPATIIPLTWPKYDDPFGDPSRRFETDARRLRYKALGLACQHYGINHLLLAHHADDQAETVLMRMALLRWRTGLQGMHAAEWIPECYGIHGVHHSGMPPVKRLEYPRTAKLPIPVEQGGIQILRPLLNFNKDQLIATCKDREVPWAEDRTNQDPTLTARNAVRHVFIEHHLPKALSRQSLVALANTIKSRVAHHTDRVEGLFTSGEMEFKLDVQTGSLSVRFPTASALLDRSIISKADKTEARDTACLLLERLAKLVDFKENTPISKLSTIVSAIWPELRDDTDDPAVSMCAFGLLWRKCQGSIFSQLSYTKRNHDLMNWLISRQPLERHELGANGLRLEFAPASATLPLDSSERKPMPIWQLFDRWWFHVENRTREHTIVLRFITDEELSQVRKNAQKAADDQYRDIRQALNRIKPVSLCRNLPALFIVSPTGEQQLVALPTLGVSTVFPEGSVFATPPCVWDVRYKKLDERDCRFILIPEDRSRGQLKKTNRNRRESVPSGFNRQPLSSRK